VKTIHSLPEPREFGFKWRPFEKARKKLAHVGDKRREVQRKEAELKARIEGEKQEDVKRLATSILEGKDESPAPELEDLARKMKELNRLSQALQTAEPQAEAEVMDTVRQHQGQWISEVDAEVVRSLEEERKAYEKAMQIADSARLKRLHLQTLSDWLRRTPPSFGPPADVTVRSTFDRLKADIDQAERMHHERAANERLAAQEAARLEREAREGEVA
jgi:hypothetical protein